MSSLNNPVEFLTKVRQALTLDLVPTNQEQAVFVDLVHKGFDKKYIVDTRAIDTRGEAIKLFLGVNSRMREINQSPAIYYHQWSSNAILRRARNFVHEILGQHPEGLLHEMFLRAKHSSGTSIGVKFSDTSLEAKNAWPYSGTPACVRLWEHYRNWDSDLYTSICNLNEVSPHREETVTVDGSRATTVPKTNRIDRFISVEPTLNMFFQQGVMSLMTEQLEKFGLSVIKDQEVHRGLAYLASVTGSYATVDFSSMSDSLSLSVCHFLLPKDWYSLLFTIRSHRSRLPDGSTVDLEMMSTMGNATTFPLETLILYCIAESCVVTSKGYTNVLERLSKNCYVYGDDCIVPTSAVGLFIETCHTVGFVANVDKTFVSGPFRESCGGDFYRGRDVRIFYLKTLPGSRKRRDQEAYLYSTINGVIRMYIKYFGPLAYVYDKQLLTFLFKELHSVTTLVKFVPESFPEDSGITSLRDAQRLIRAYRLRPSRVGVNQHGMLDFPYLRFDFPFRAAVHDGLRYSTFLKSRTFTCLEMHAREYKRRECGFYVERRARYGSGNFLIGPCNYPSQLS